MAPYARISRNLANLIPRSRKPVNSVNLGNLYANSTRRQRRGFAFFEDGSVFISRDLVCQDDYFETDMKLLQSFVRQPTRKLESIRQSDPDRRRLLIIQRSNDTGTLHEIHARNASDGEDPTSRLHQMFQQINLETDPSHSRLLSIHVDPSPRRGRGNFNGPVLDALREFRGTLVDGVLQPRTRLSNALKLSDGRDKENPFWAITDSAGTQQSPNSVKMAAVKNSSVATREQGMDPYNMHSYLLNETAQQSSHRSGAMESGSQYAPLRTEDTELFRQRELDLTWRRGIELSQTRETELFEQREAERSRNRKAIFLRQQEARLNVRERQLLRLQQKLLEKTITPPSTSPNLPAEGGAGWDARLAEVEARERELQHREEVLKWKRRAFVLEQRLAMTGATDTPYPPENGNHAPASCPSPGDSPSSELLEQDPSDGVLDNSPPDPYSEFDLEAPPRIPKRIRQGRTRIRLPR